MSDEPTGVDKAIATKAIVLVSAQSDIDQLEGELIERRLGAGQQDLAEAFLYVIPQGDGGKPIVGASADLVKQFVRVMNASGGVQLTIQNSPPIIEEITIDGRPHVRAIVSSIDHLTGIIQWAVKEEARVSGRGHKNAHAATTALEKAMRKALESHPAYNRQIVNAQIKKFMLKNGLDPTQFQIGPSGGAWSDIFGRAKAKGVKPQALRDGVTKATGKSLSEAETPAEVKAAVHATDELIPGITNSDGVVEEHISPADAKVILELRARSLEILKQLGTTPDDIAAYWSVVGSPRKTVNDYRRLHHALNLISVGKDPLEALGEAIKKWPGVGEAIKPEPAAV